MLVLSRRKNETLMIGSDIEIVVVDVRGDKARLYVNDAKEPTLVVNDVKTGVNGKGAIALWIDTDTVAHFRNLSVSK